MSHERGASAIELALTVPVVLLVLALAAPLVQTGREYVAVARAAGAGVRYASRADTNARRTPAGTLTRRPSPPEVEAFVRDAAGPASVESVSVSPDPSTAVPGTTITLTVTHEMRFGPLAAAANRLAGASLLPERHVVTITKRAREE